jgi:hypothetical protein
MQLRGKSIGLLQSFSFRSLNRRLFGSALSRIG